MKLLDKMYFAISDHYKGLKYGQCKTHEQGYNNGWDDGFENGVISSRKAVINKLENMNLNASDQSFQLGYLHALAIAKGEI